MKTLYVYNSDTQTVIAVIKATNFDEAEKAAESFLTKRVPEHLFFSSGGYSPQSDEGKSYIRHNKKNGIFLPLAIRSGEFNSYVAYHPDCVRIGE